MSEEYKVHFRPGADLVVMVVAEDYDDAIDKAHELVPEHLICARCSGWGDTEPYLLDVSSVDIEADAVYVGDTLVYEQPTVLDEVRESLAVAESRIATTLSFLDALRSRMADTPGLLPVPQVEQTIDTVEALLKGRTPKVAG